MGNKKIIILDFSTAEVHVFPYDENVWDDGEDFIEDENYLTSTEKFILPSGNEATMEVFSDTGELLYTNKIEHGSSN